MQLSKFLGRRVIDAAQHPVGTVIDVRLAMTGDPEHDPDAPRVLGLVISPHTKSSFLGYERSGANAPVVLAALFVGGIEAPSLPAGRTSRASGPTWSGFVPATPGIHRCCATGTDRHV